MTTESLNTPVGWLAGQKMDALSSTGSDIIVAEMGVDLRDDLSQYSWRSWCTEPWVWAVAHYRIGRSLITVQGLRGSLLRALHTAVGAPIKAISGVEIPRTATIGGALRIFHGRGIVVHSGSVIGSHCTLRHGVTIGVRKDGGGTPVIGDRVEFGAYAQVLGDVKIGDDAKIGAMALVLDDVPANGVAFAPKATIEPPRSK